jgi:pyruvate formate lyase activating enzyme
LAQQHREIIIRVPVIPGFNDDDANLAATGRFAAALDGVARIDILPHHEAARGKLARLAGGYELLEVEPPRGTGYVHMPYPPTTAEQMDRIAKRLEDFGLEVKIGG